MLALEMKVYVTRYKVYGFNPFDLFLSFFPMKFDILHILHILCFSSFLTVSEMSTVFRSAFLYHILNRSALLGVSESIQNVCNGLNPLFCE